MEKPQMPGPYTPVRIELDPITAGWLMAWAEMEAPGPEAKWLREALRQGCLKLYGDEFAPLKDEVGG